MCHSLAANRANAICCCWRSATLPCMRLIAGGVANCNYDLADVTLHVINSWCRKLLLAGGESRSNSSLPSSPPPPPWKVGQTVLTQLYFGPVLVPAYLHYCPLTVRISQLKLHCSQHLMTFTEQLMRATPQC